MLDDGESAQAKDPTGSSLLPSSGDQYYSALFYYWFKQKSFIYGNVKKMLSRNYGLKKFLKSNFANFSHFLFF